MKKKLRIFNPKNTCALISLFWRNNHFFAFSYESYGKINTFSIFMKPIENKPILTCPFSCRMDNPLPPVRREFLNKNTVFI